MKPLEKNAARKIFPGNLFTRIVFSIGSHRTPAPIPLAIGELLVLWSGTSFAERLPIKEELVMSISLSGLLSSPSLGVSSTNTNLKPLPTETESAEQKFLDYMKMSPAERLYDAILSQLGLTKDEVNAMDPAAKKAVEEKIQQMIKQEAERSNDKRTGLIADVSV